MPRPLRNLIAVAGATAAAFAVLAALMAAVWTAGGTGIPGLAELSFMLFLLVAWLGAFLFGAAGWPGVVLPLALLAFFTSAIAHVVARQKGRGDRAFYLRCGGWAGFCLFLATCAAPVLLQSLGSFVLTVLAWGLCGVLAGRTAGAVLHAILTRFDPEMG